MKSPETSLASVVSCRGAFTRDLQQKPRIRVLTPRLMVAAYYFYVQSSA